MNDERPQIRSTLAGAAGIVGWVLLVIATVAAFSLWRARRAEKAALESERTARDSDNAAWKSAEVKLESRLSEQTLLLKGSEEELAIFVALAAKQFPDAPADARLDRLRKHIAALLNPPDGKLGKRFIGRDGVARLRAMLTDAPAFDVEIGCVTGDTDSLAICEELRAAFEAAGSKVREFVRYPPSPTNLRGVSIHSKPQHDGSLGDIVGQIFREVSQEKNQWVGKEDLGPLTPGLPEPDIRIFVGSK